MGAVRKLENIHQELKPLEKQAWAEGFFNNIKNADKLGGLVEDIRDAVMHYQVCNWNELVTFMPDIRFRRHYNKISIARATDSL